MDGRILYRAFFVYGLIICLLVSVVCICPGFFLVVLVYQNLFVWLMFSKFRFDFEGSSSHHKDSETRQQASVHT